MLLPKWNRFLLFLSLLASVLIAHAARAAWSTSPWTPSRYSWQVQPDLGEERLYADCGLTLLNRSEAPRDTVQLLLYRMLKVTSLTDGDGTPLRFTQCVESFDDWEAFQANLVTIPLPAPVAPGDSTHLSVEYEGPMRGYIETGMLYVQDNIGPQFTILRLDAFAYPVPAVPSLAANRGIPLASYSYEIEATVPDSMVAANGGELVGKTPADGVTTFRYRNLRPAWRMDVAVAGYAVLPQPDGSRIYAFPEDSLGAVRLAGAMDSTLALYASWFGPRRGDWGISVIEIPDGYGSQTDVTCILQTSGPFTRRDQYDQFYHELSHLWNLTPTEDHPSRVESEGLAMFLQYRVRELLDGENGAIQRGAERLRDRFIASCRKDDRYRTTPIADYGRENLTGASYTKGMVFFTLLYRLVGEERFDRTIRDYYAAHPDGKASLKDFVAAWKAMEGSPLDRFLQEWLYGTVSSELLLGPDSLEQILARYRG